MHFKNQTVMNKVMRKIQPFIENFYSPLYFMKSVNMEKFF